MSKSQKAASGSYFVSQHKRPWKSRLIHCRRQRVQSLGTITFDPTHEKQLHYHHGEKISERVVWSERDEIEKGT